MTAPDIADVWSQIQAIDAKATEIHGNSKSPISPALAEALSNLFISTGALKSAIQRDLLQQLPATLQQTLVSDLTNSYEALDHYEDQEVQLLNNIEQLYAHIWEYRLNELSPGFDVDAALNRAKRYETEIADMQSKIAAVLILSEGVAPLKQQLDEILLSFELAKTTITASTTDATAGVSQIEARATEALTHVERIKSFDNDASEFRAKAQANSSAVSALKEQIDTFAQDVTRYKTEIAATTTSATELVIEKGKEIGEFLATGRDSLDKSVTAFKDEGNQRIQDREKAIADTFEKLEFTQKEADKVLIKATGKTLFESFNKRRSVLVVSKWAWVVIVFVLLGIAYWYGSSLADWVYVHQIKDISAAIYLKFALSLPLAGAIWFAVAQYAKERAFEEEYAYRSNISVSLVPYRDEVIKLFKDDDEAGKKMFAEFVIGAVERVYSPINVHQKDAKDDANILSSLPKGASEFVESVTKLAKVLK